MIIVRTPVRFCCAFAAIVTLLVAAPASHAALVGADLNGSNPLNWTPITSGTFNNLVDETGAPPPSTSPSPAISAPPKASTRALSRPIRTR